MLRTKSIFHFILYSYYFQRCRIFHQNTNFRIHERTFFDLYFREKNFVSSEGKREQGNFQRFQNIDIINEFQIISWYNNSEIPFLEWLFAFVGYIRYHKNHKAKGSRREFSKNAIVESFGNKNDELGCSDTIKLTF